jgi:hypothetical protein
VYAAVGSGDEATSWTTVATGEEIAVRWRELLQQRKEREALMASGGTKRRTTTHQIAFGRSVDSTNSIIVSIVNSKKNKTVAHITIKKSQNFAPHSVVTSREMVAQCGKSTDEAKHGAYISNVIS